MEKGQLWTVVGVAFVVAVIASVVASSITGNVIRVNDYKYGKYDVYTKQEVDSMLKKITESLYSIERRLNEIKNTTDKSEGCSYNEMCAEIYLVEEIFNDTDSYTQDRVSLFNLKTGEVVNSRTTGEGEGYLVLSGKNYKLNYYLDSKKFCEQNDVSCYIKVVDYDGKVSSAFRGGYLVLNIKK